MLVLSSLDIPNLLFVLIPLYGNLGFFLYTFPGECSELFVTANANILKNADIDAALLYFLEVDMDDVGMEVSHLGCEPYPSAFFFFVSHLGFISLF